LGTLCEHIIISFCTLCTDFAGDSTDAVARQARIAQIICTSTGVEGDGKRYKSLPVINPLLSEATFLRIWNVLFDLRCRHINVNKVEQTTGTLRNQYTTLKQDALVRNLGRPKRHRYPLVLTK